MKLVTARRVFNALSFVGGGILLAHSWVDWLAISLMLLGFAGNSDENNNDREKRIKAEILQELKKKE